MTFQQRAKEAIHKSGGRMTSQRTLLIDLLAGLNEDVSAEHLFQLAVEDDPSISLPTIYRTLNTLETAHLITSQYVSRDHDRKIYRVKAKADHRLHFTCRQCGQVIPFQSDVIEQLKHDLMVQFDVDVSTICTCAGGLCADCREEKNNDPT
jgi:Fur family ferric uptake transcriptional regulator